MWARIWQLWLAFGTEIFSSYHRRYRSAEMRTFAEAGSSMHKLCSNCDDNRDVWTLTFTSFKRGGPLVEAIRGIIIVECTRCYALQH